MKITLFLADDHAIVRDGLKAALSFHPEFLVVGEAADGRETWKQVLRLKPDLVLMDIAMSGLNGIEVTRLLREAQASTRVLILSMLSSTEHVCQAIEAGAQGYVLKGSTSAELIAAIHAVARHGDYLDSRIPPAVLASYRDRKEGRFQKNPLARLTPREREVLQLVVDGKSSAEIGRQLSLSISTVDTYRSRLMVKLGVSNVVELVKFVMQNQGYTTDSPTSL